jgi:hypothetical protein
VAPNYQPIGLQSTDLLMTTGDLIIGEQCKGCMMVSETQPVHELIEAA